MDKYLKPYFFQGKEPNEEKKTENAALNPGLVSHLDEDDTSSDDGSSVVEEVKKAASVVAAEKNEPIVVDADVKEVEAELENFAPFTLVKRKTFTW